MTLDLNKMPYFDPAPGTVSLDARRALLWDGSKSYRAGLAITDCPGFADADMGAYWCIGWRHGHDKEYERDPAIARARCLRYCNHQPATQTKTGDRS